jgi:hypothetical protein
MSGVANGRSKPCDGCVLEPERGDDHETIMPFARDEDHGGFDLEALGDRAEQQLEASAAPT